MTYIHTDHLNTPRLGTNDTQTLVWQYQSQAFGQGQADKDPDKNGINVNIRLRFPGQYRDGESGLYYNYFRYYDPTTGRYITSDPIGLRGGLNSYGYVGGNPLGAVDHFGLAACNVLFPDYPITYSSGRTSTWLGGHAGVLGYDENGSTRYYDYGRYSPNRKGVFGEKLPSDQGNVRRIGVPDLEIGPDGKPTSESLEKLQDALSRRAGKGTKAELSCDADANEDKVYDYVNDIANDPNRTPYSWHPWLANQCRTFARDALGAGQ